ncbi:MAG: LCP family protein [Thermoleophilia bacterium]|nr:LCP family protein [Thermoleophilia bacterium]
MARQDKPYRVYRGGRAKGKVPALPRPDGGPPRGRPPAAAGAPRVRRRRLGWRRGLLLLVFLLLVALVAWGVMGYLAFERGVERANARLGNSARAALVPQDGLLVSKPTIVLLLGTDHAGNIPGRRDARRADSIQLVRTDPRRNRLAFLSIPRDLRVAIPGHGFGKANSAFPLGGVALAIETVRALTGLPVNHVAVVDFGSFRGLIDAIGGITVDVPKPILSNRFDCPYATAERCRDWPGWRFGRGKQRMDGRRALVYSRIRENRLDPGESDLTRAQRQQDVVQAIAEKLLGPRTLARMPWIGDEVLRPLATDLTAPQFLQLGWRKVRADESRTLHCRLGGAPANVGGESVLIGETDDNLETLAMFRGRAAPQPPPRGAGPFAPGCVVGRARFG